MKKWLLWGILLVAFLLRILFLSRFPAGFTPDEASFGFDAYSILKTGKDQWGTSFPLILKSFGDFKSPLYSYLSIPFVFLFGLTRFAVRLPNALLGTASVYIVFLLTKELFPKKKIAAYISSFLFAVSPWHIMMSRGAFEANLTTFFLPLGIYLFFRGLKSKKYFIWSFLVFGLNLFTYHSAKFVTPIIVFLLLILFFKNLNKKQKELKIGIGIFTLFLAGMVYTLSLGGGSRAKEISIYNGALEEAAKTRIELINEGMNPILARLAHNKYQTSLKRFFLNYKQYFSLKFLFTDGPAESTYGMMPGTGVLYWFELPLLIGALIYLIKRGYKEKSILLLFAWLFLAPIPASLTMGRGYAGNRSVIALPCFQILFAIGAVYLYDLLKSRKNLGIAYSLVSLVFVGGFVKDYFVGSPSILDKGMLSGNLEVSKWLKENAKDREIIVSRRISEPQIYIAFENKWDPKDFQENSKSLDYEEYGVNWVDQIPQYSLGNYLFKNIEEEDLNSGKVLVGRPEEFSKDVVPLKTFSYLDGTASIIVVDTNPNIFAYESD